jgi:hypothetical protein
VCVGFTAKRLQDSAQGFNRVSTLGDTANGDALKGRKIPCLDPTNQNIQNRPLILGFPTQSHPFRVDRYGRREPRVETG